MRQTFSASLSLLAVAPAFALAWGPYDPYPPQPYFDGAPGGYGQPYPMPPGPAGYGYPAGPLAAPDQAPYQAPSSPTQGTAPDQSALGAPPSLGAPAWGGYGRPLGQRSAFPRLDVSRGMDGDDYLIDIQVQNIEPDQVQVHAAGRGLMIVYDQSVQTNRQDDLPGGDGYRRSYSVSRGASTRRVGLPSDAKVAEMSREVKEGHILLRIPRAAGLPQGYR